jgi:prevent-host-death family protein
LQIAQVVDPFGVDKGFAYVQHKSSVSNWLRIVELLMVHSRKNTVQSPIATRPLKDYIQSMHYSTQVKPISYLKTHAAQVLAQITADREPLVITQNGEARAVLQDVASYEETQDTLALLKLLALGNQEVADGKTKPLTDVVKRLRAKHPKT